MGQASSPSALVSLLCAEHALPNIFTLNQTHNVKIDGIIQQCANSGPKASLPYVHLAWEVCTADDTTTCVLLCIMHVLLHDRKRERKCLVSIAILYVFVF